jgi:hypothetical protein
MLLLSYKEHYNFNNEIYLESVYSTAKSDSCTYTNRGYLNNKTYEIHSM